MTITARVVFAGFFIAAYVSAFVELVDHPSLSELGQDGHGYAMLVMAIASVVVAWLVPPARIAGVALAVVAVCALVITPAADARDPEGAWLAFAGLAVVLAIAAMRGSNNWVRGVRCGAVPVIGGIFALQVGLLADAIETLDSVAQWLADRTRGTPASTLRRSRTTPSGSRRSSSPRSWRSSGS